MVSNVRAVSRGVAVRALLVYVNIKRECESFWLFADCQYFHCCLKWSGWGEFILLGKFPAYLGPTLVNMYRAGEHLISWELVHCAMRGKHGQLLNWREWTPTKLERYEMIEAAEKAAIKEAEEA